MGQSPQLEWSISKARSALLWMRTAGLLSHGQKAVWPHPNIRWSKNDDPGLIFRKKPGNRYDDFPSDFFSPSQWVHFSCFVARVPRSPGPHLSPVVVSPRWTTEENAIKKPTENAMKKHMNTQTENADSPSGISFHVGKIEERCPRW